MSRQALLVVVMGLFMMMGVGCCPLTRLNINVKLDPSLQGRDIDVDVVAVKEAEDARWNSMSMTKYWTSGDTQRKAPNIKTLHFTAKEPDQTIKADDKIWDTWMAGASDKHPPKIYVLVQLPGTFDEARDDKPGAQDARRQILSTKACENNRGMFDPPPTVHLVISRDRVSLQ